MTLWSGPALKTQEKLWKKKRRMIHGSRDLYRFLRQFRKIKPGISKNKIQDTIIEKELESIDDRILWVRVRIEGVSLKVKVIEKVNPPDLEENTINDCISKMDGEVKKIYVKSGTAVVKPGDMVKEGDVLIKAQDGKEGLEYEEMPSRPEEFWIVW